MKISSGVSQSHKGDESFEIVQYIQAILSRLPVQTLLLQCSVCAHGGHQECYQRYYMEWPMVEVDIPSEPLNESHGCLTASPLLSGNEQDDNNTLVVDNGPGTTKTVGSLQTSKFSGHPYATGCGHFCWAATGMPVGNDNWHACWLGHLRIPYWRALMTLRDLFRVGISVINLLQHNRMYKTTDYTVRPTRVHAFMPS